MLLLPLYRRSPIYIIVPEELTDVLAEARLCELPADQQLGKVPA